MEFSVAEKNNCVVITLNGKIMGGPPSKKFHEQIKELIDQDKTKVIGDLSNVTFVNSSGLGVFIAALTSLRNAGGELMLCSASDKIESLFKISKLFTIFNYYKTLDKAIEAANK